MFSVHPLYLQAKPRLSGSKFRSIDQQKSTTLPNQILLFRVGHATVRKRKAERSSYGVRAVDKDSQQFEIDQEKAREALEKLDQQLQSLSSKQARLPKIKASDVKLTSEPMMKEEPPEISGSFLGYTAFFLLFFTVLYNLFFYTVIRPSIDGA